MPPPDIAPTAIIPHRPVPLQERFDLLARRLGDPLVRLFLIASTSQSEENQIRAASELLPYRYPKLRATEVKLDGASTAIQFNINL